MSLTKKQCDEFWAMADANKDGELTIQELKAAIEKFKPGITNKEIASIFCGIDSNQDKKISQKEFCDEMEKKPKRSEALLKLFQQYDRNGDGKLSTDEVRKLIVETKLFKPEVVDKAAKDIIQRCDSSGDGYISFDEFKQAC